MSSGDANPFPNFPIGALLRFAVDEVRRRIYAGVTAAGFDDVAPAHVTVFRWPGADGRRPGEVAADVQLSKQRLNDLLRDLERRDYLWLEPDPADRRARIIRLTPKGARLQQVAIGVHAELEEEWARLLGRTRYARLRDALAALMPAIAPGPAADAARRDGGQPVSP
jgi:DNA-binding MarR family transcriptional regulator